MPYNKKYYDHLADFDFDLPEQLIAQYPLSERSASRLLSVDIDNQQMHHQQFTDLVLGCAQGTFWY